MHVFTCSFNTCLPDGLGTCSREGLPVEVLFWQMTYQQQHELMSSRSDQRSHTACKAQAASSPLAVSVTHLIAVAQADPVFPAHT